MSIHSHSTWDFGQPITDELIDEIVYIMNANRPFFAFAILNRVDEIAYKFGCDGINGISIDIKTSIELSDPQVKDQIREIYNKVKEKLQ